MLIFYNKDINNAKYCHKVTSIWITVLTHKLTEFMSIIKNVTQIITFVVREYKNDIVLKFSIENLGR